mgnify:CR=1 FL=1
MSIGYAATGLHAVAAPWGERPAVMAQMSAPWGERPAVMAQMSTPWGERPAVMAQMSASWAAGAAVVSHLSAPWGAAERPALAALCAVRWSAPDPAPIILSGQTRLLHQGRAIGLVGSVEISCDEGSPTWICSPTLAEADDYARIQLGDALTLELSGATWALICDGRRYADSESGPEYALSCSSPVSLLGAPWALDAAAPGGGMARNLVEGLVGAVDWQLVDWPVPSAALSADGAPLTLARSIVEAVGGVLDSLPDGSLIARRRHPVSPPEYAGAAVAALSDRELLGAAEDADAVEIFDRFTVTSDGAAEAAVPDIQIESEAVEGDPHAYDVRVYPYPLRPIALVHTGDSATVIGPRQAWTEEREELVELRAGVGSVSHPVETLLDVQYQYNSLGALTHDGGALTAATSGYSLARVRYRTAGYAWRVTNARVESIQFLAMESR